MRPDDLPDFARLLASSLSSSQVASHYKRLGYEISRATVHRYRQRQSEVCDMVRLAKYFPPVR